MPVVVCDNNSKPIVYTANYITGENNKEPCQETETSCYTPDAAKYNN